MIIDGPYMHMHNNMAQQVSFTKLTFDYSNQVKDVKIYNVGVYNYDKIC